jgi:Holliday junction DNA helicase RuvA
MIGRLRGILLEVNAPDILIDVQGVAYDVKAPLSTCYRLPEVGQEIILLTHLAVREDAHTLFGFIDKHERTLFRSLIKVNGIGPKLALTILSSIDSHDFVAAIHNEDLTRLIRLPGIGKKTAERLLIEMADKLDEWEIDLAKQLPLSDNKPRAVIDEAQAALVSLGFKPQEAMKILKQIPAEGLSAEELLRKALQALS